MHTTVDGVEVRCFVCSTIHPDLSMMFCSGTTTLQPLLQRERESMQAAQEPAWHETVNIYCVEPFHDSQLSNDPLVKISLSVLSVAFL